MADRYSGILRHHAGGHLLHVWTPGLAVPPGMLAVVIRPRRGRGYWRALTPLEASAHVEDAARDATRDYLRQYRLPGRHDGWIVGVDGYRRCQWWFDVRGES